MISPHESSMNRDCKDGTNAEYSSEPPHIYKPKKVPGPFVAPKKSTRGRRVQTKDDCTKYSAGVRSPLVAPLNTLL